MARCTTMQEALLQMRNVGVMPQPVRMGVFTREIVQNFAVSYYGHRDARAICMNDDIYNSYLCRNLTLETLKGLRDSAGRLRRNYIALSCHANSLNYSPTATINDKNLLNGITLMFAGEFYLDAEKTLKQMISRDQSGRLCIYPLRFSFSKDGNWVVSKKTPMAKYKIMAYLTAPVTHRCFIVGYTPAMLRRAIADEIIHFTDTQKQARARFMTGTGPIFMKYGTPQLEADYAEWVLNSGVTLSQQGSSILGGYASGKFLGYKQNATGAKPKTNCAFTDGVYEYMHTYFTKAIQDFNNICDAMGIPEEVAAVYYAAPTFFAVKIPHNITSAFSRWINTYSTAEVGALTVNTLLSSQLI